MNSRIALAAGTVVLAAALASVPIAASAGSRPIDSADLVGALTRTASATDAVPSSLDPADVGRDGIVAASARRVGERDGRTFWVATGVNGDLCLIIASDDRLKSVAATCNNVALVSQRGLQLGVQTGSTETVAYLLPDGVLDRSIGGGWTTVGANVVVGDASHVGRVAVPLPGGANLVLQP